MEALKRASARLAASEAERERAASERDRVLAEESRARAQAEAASRAKDEFLAMLGHELRNPLGAIGNAMRVIERLPASSADHKAAREIIARQTAHLAKIVDDLLDVGRLVSGRILLKRNLVDLAQAAAASVAAVRAGEPGRAHEWKLELDTVLVSADPTRIDQVLANLIGNAAKFTPAGGEIRVRVRQDGDEALLSVEDTGPGIRPRAAAACLRSLCPGRHAARRRRPRDRPIAREAAGRAARRQRERREHRSERRRPLHA